MRLIRALFLPLFWLASGCLFGQPWSGIVAPSRAVDWSNAGVVGDIPARTTVCSTLNSGATVAQINTAIQNCPAGQTVQLAAGTFNLSAGIVINGHSNVTLRGMGADQTFLIFSNSDACKGLYADVCVESSDTNWSGGPTNGPVSWTAGYSKGTSTITLASTPNLKVGNPLILDQLDDSSDGGGIYVCSSTTCSLQGGGGGQRSGRYQYQIATVAACNGNSTAGAACSGSNVSVTISPGLDMPNWSSSKSPQAWWASGPIQGVGIENMSLDHSASHYMGIGFFNALNSWVKGVRDINTARTHVSAQYSTHITVRDSYFFLTQNSLDQSYGFECFASSNALVENNIYQGISGPLTMNGCTGTVMGYNYAINDYYEGNGWINAMSNVHTAGDAMLLYEGNKSPQFYSDVFHGSHNFNTYFRNRALGNQPTCYKSGSSTNYPSNVTWAACTNPLVPIILQSYSRFYNVIGNVLGQTGIQNSYQNGGTYGTGTIFSIGGGNDPVPSDANTTTTLMRWGNYDTVNAANRFVASEVPSGLSGAQAAYANPIPAGNNLPASFYLSGKPTWWPSGKAWPPIGPDVTGGNETGVGGHANTIPAEDCYLNIMGGPSNGVGTVLKFNAAACYSSQVQVPPPTSLAAPTSLSAAVH